VEATKSGPVDQFRGPKGRRDLGFIEDRRGCVRQRTELPAEVGETHRNVRCLCVSAILIRTINMTQTVQTKELRGRRVSSLRRVAIVAGLLALGACATAPQPPNQALQAAELAIANADQARVADTASPELTEARAKLTAARDAAHQEQMVLAERLAVESRTDAELASANFELAKAVAVNEDMQKSIVEMKQEMQRKTGAAQ
jgi:hypothetical protein